MRPRRTDERGAALLTTMVAVAVLTAVAVDLAYSSRVSLQIAANARDELRAVWAARGGVQMARLVLSFQQQLDDASPQGAGGGARPPGVPGVAAPAPGAAGAAGAAGGLAGALGGALAGALGSLPRVQLWNLVPIDTSLVRGLFPGAEVTSATAPAEGPPAPSRGATFDAAVEDEGRKVNVQLEGLAQTGDQKLWGQVQSLYQLVCDARWDPLFDREDGNGVRSTREELLVRLRDWVDNRPGSSELVVAGGTGTTCGMLPGQPPFVPAFGDKNQPYDKGEDRYRAKQARMDSLDELYLVAGVGDAFMAAFGDAVTVYLPRDTPRNVNELDGLRLVQLARVMADPPIQPIFLDPTLPGKLQQAVMERTLGGILSITPADLAMLVQLAGVRVNAAVLGSTTTNSAFTDRSTTFRIRATGKAGAVRSTIDAVVRMEKPTTADPIPVPGRLIHWREE